MCCRIFQPREQTLSEQNAPSAQDLLNQGMVVPRSPLRMWLAGWMVVSVFILYRDPALCRVAGATRVCIFDPHVNIRGLYPGAIAQFAGCRASL